MWPGEAPRLCGRRDADRYPQVAFVSRYTLTAEDLEIRLRVARPFSKLPVNARDREAVNGSSFAR
jgi:hypothetical protein